MQAQREFPPSLNDVKDKFLVQYCTVDGTVKEAVAETFDATSGKEVKQTKLRVVLVCSLPVYCNIMPVERLLCTVQDDGDRDRSHCSNHLCQELQILVPELFSKWA